MKYKVKVKGLTYRGNKKTIKINIDFPDFKIIPEKEIHGIMFPPTSIESQLDDYLHDLDFSHVMYDHDLDLILDREVIFPKIKDKKSNGVLTQSKQEEGNEILEYFKLFITNESMLADAIATYTLIKDSIKSFSLSKQFEMVLSHMNIGYKASIHTLDSINENVENKNKERLDLSKHQHDPETGSIRRVLDSYKHKPENQ